MSHDTPTPAGRTVNGALAARLEVAPGATVEVPYALAWHYPNKYDGAGVWMGCHYATRGPDARTLMREVVANFQVWREKTERFRAAVYDSTLTVDAKRRCLGGWIPTLQRAGKEREFGSRRHKLAMGEDF